ncbi:HAMP domain-containing histidine kinase [Alteromonadaceae bacterium M269]|nr:HAMP domain-containing histidine kinase [Alteromonadaceae bacterium M269]
MKLCFYQRLAISVVGVFMLVIGLFLWWSSHLQMNTQLHAQQLLHADLAQELVKNYPELNRANEQPQRVNTILSDLSRLMPGFEFYLLDTTGQVTHRVENSAPLERDKVDLTPIQGFISNDKSSAIRGDDPLHSDTGKVFSAASLASEQGMQGYLYVIIGGKQYDSVVSMLNDDKSMQRWALFVAISLMLLLGLLLALFRYFTAPLRSLSKAMQAVTSADFTPDAVQKGKMSWEAQSSNEVHKLGTAFNNTLDHIHSQFEELQQLDSMRREMLANLAHDLRTPLAKLQGYMEMLQTSSASLNDEQRARYVSVCRRSAQNLQQLINQMFEYTYLETGQYYLEKEAFPVAELIYDVVAKFQEQAQERSLEIVINPSQFNYQVYTDMGKLERVLSNIIDNAIRHTNKGGKIEIRVYEESGRVRFDVIDNGIGISELDIPKIFDPRFQAENTNVEDGTHAGLGLPISKKLLTLLDSDIRVESELGKGTRFTFGLAKAA